MIKSEAMYTEFSWKGYLIITTLIVIAYYAIIGLWYYSHKLRTPLSNKAFIKASKASNQTNPKVSPLKPELIINNNTQQEIDELIKALNNVISRAFKRKYNRKKLLKSISWILKKHTYLKDTPLQASIHETIIKECEKYGPVGLREEELMGLWSSDA